jgi:hypothetical protein
MKWLVFQLMLVDLSPNQDMFCRVGFLDLFLSFPARHRVIYYKLLNFFLAIKGVAVPFISIKKSLNFFMSISVTSLGFFALPEIWINCA